MVVKAVSVSRLRPWTPDITAKTTSVIAGEKIPRALATLTSAYTLISDAAKFHDQPDAL